MEKSCGGVEGGSIVFWGHERPSKDGQESYIHLGQVGMIRRGGMGNADKQHLRPLYRNIL